MFGFKKKHKWSDWLINEVGIVSDTVYRKQIGNYIIQTRFCSVCGKTQIDRQSTSYLTPGNYFLIPSTQKTSPKSDPLTTIT